MSLQRELRASWGPGYPSRVQFGGGDAAEDNTWEQLGAEEDAVVRVQWNPYVLTNATVKEAVNKYCDPATRHQMVEQYGPIADWNVSRVTSMEELSDTVTAWTGGPVGSSASAAVVGSPGGSSVVPSPSPPLETSGESSREG